MSSEENDQKRAREYAEVHYANFIEKDRDIARRAFLAGVASERAHGVRYKGDADRSLNLLTLAMEKLEADYDKIRDLYAKAHVVAHGIMGDRDYIQFIRRMDVLREAQNKPKEKR